MTDNEILKKAIEKAIKNGYKPIWDGENWNKNEFIFVVGSDYRWMKVIFSHGFAEAFWGEEEMDDYGPDAQKFYVWEHHLQQMVLENKPVRYLKRFL